MKYFKLLACKVLQREIASIAYKCPNTIDVTMVKQWYHETPEILKKTLQEEIDRIDENTDPHTDNLERRDLDAILLGYGLCSNAVVGLKSKKYKIVIPRAHDCTTLVMGSKEAYQDYFNTYKGSYFYTRGWLELGAVLGNMEEKLERKRKEYMEKYEDEDTVEYLLDVDRQMLKNYSCITYVEWPELSEPLVEAKVKEVADERKWTYNHMVGNNSLLTDLLNGNWDEERFLVLEPGQTVAPSYDEMVVRVGKDS